MNAKPKLPSPPPAAASLGGGAWLPAQTILFGGAAAGAILLALWLLRAEAGGGPAGGLTARWMLGGAAGDTTEAGVFKSARDAWNEAGPVAVEVPEGTPIGALVDGEVVYAEVIRGFGGFVVIRTGTPRPLDIEYQFLSDELGARLGPIRAGDVIGWAGRQGDGEAEGVQVEVSSEERPLPATALGLTPRELESRLFPKAASSAGLD